MCPMTKGNIQKLVSDISFILFSLAKHGLLMTCYLVGDHGPSCVSMSQIPDLCVIHVRLIKAVSAGQFMTAPHSLLMTVASIQ